MAIASSGGTTALRLIQNPSTKHPPSSSSCPFFGNKLKPVIPSSSRTTATKLAAKAELVDAARDLFVGVGVGLPCTVMECGDIIYRSTLPKSNGLTVTAPGVALALAALSYLWSTPGVAPGFFDMFVLAFLERLFRTTYRKVRACFYLLVFVFVFIYGLPKVM